MNNYNIFATFTALMELLLRDKKAVMALTSAYIGDKLAYELRCDGITASTHNSLCDAVRKDEYLRSAMKNSGLLQVGVRCYANDALSNYDTWYHYLDVIAEIAADQELLAMLDVRKRYIISSLLEYWDKGQLDDQSWDRYLADLKIAAS
jgi:hypothetical protein